MRARLVPHPDTPSAAVTGVEVEIERTSSGLTLRYWLSGDVDAVLWPAPAAPERADELWKHTCFELFVKHADGAAYDEFNFCPSSQWGAYRFTGYRTGMCALVLPPPRIALDGSNDVLAMTVELDWPVSSRARIAASAVIEEVGGAKSYWALAHAPGKPDFHHPSSFTLALA